MKGLFLKGFEIELFTGSSLGQHFGVSDDVAREFSDFVKEIESFVKEQTFSLGKKFNELVRSGTLSQIV